VQHRRSLCVQNATQAQNIRSNEGLRCQSATDGPEHQNARKATPRLANSPESGSLFIRSKSQNIRSSTTTASLEPHHVRIGVNEIWIDRALSHLAERAMTGIAGEADRGGFLVPLPI
jgi:hypothetical protein